MYYEINVSRNGKHLFATAERSLQTSKQALTLYREFEAKFPDCEILISQITKVGRYIPATDMPGL